MLKASIKFHSISENTQTFILHNRNKEQVTPEDADQITVSCGNHRRNIFR
jgi:protein involved in ribonucleotide reduction